MNTTTPNIDNWVKLLVEYNPSLYPPGTRITDIDWNTLFSKVITQGNYNAATIEQLINTVSQKEFDVYPSIWTPYLDGYRMLLGSDQHGFKNPYLVAFLSQEENGLQNVNIQYTVLPNNSILIKSSERLLGKVILRGGKVND